MKICFLSLNSYPVLEEKDLGSAGGAEVEQVALAKELVSYGYDVSFVTYDYGQKHLDKMEKIRVIKTYRREKVSKMNSYMKFAYIWKGLRKANADLYFYEAGSDGVMPFFSYVNKKKFIYRVPSDAVVLGGTRKVTVRFARKLEIRMADAVVAQSQFQKRILKENFDVESVIIKNGLQLQETDCEKWIPPVVLWVGTISNVKRPELFLALAKALPYVRFEMVGGRTERNPKLFEDVENAAKQLENLVFHGFVPYHEVDKYFKGASIFVNTSSVEGFPNTFIQAWAYCTPVVSLSVDPDKVIQNENLGFCSGTFRQFVSDVATLLENEELKKSIGKNGRKYVEREHDIKKIVRKYIKIFEEILYK
jgi:glycosyltransferase involved in cell wall biosynthesis